MTPEYDLRPGNGAGPFKLGDTLWQTLEYLRTNSTQYPKVEISWDTNNPQKSKIVVNLPNITLHFPPSLSQNLQLIEVIVNPPLKLKYETYTLFSSRQNLTRGDIGRLFGPTYNDSNNVLEYPGIKFNVRGSGDRGDIVENLDVMGRQGANIESIGIKECIIMPGKGLKILSHETQDITIGETTSQDLLLILGSPPRKFFKEDDRMEKMWGDQSTTSKAKVQENDCFWNYFQLGLDFMISDEGIVKKIIAYSNIPGTPLFHRYARCPWTIHTGSSTLDCTSPTSAFHSAFPSSSNSPSTSAAPVPTPSTSPVEHLTVPVPSNSKRSKKRTGSATSEASSTSAKSDTSGKDGETAVVSESSNTAKIGMLLDRIGEGGLDGVQGEMRSRLIGFEQGMIIEEDIASGGICSVLVYDPS